jgi:peptide/nickel transport system ATP-binding protein
VTPFATASKYGFKNDERTGENDLCACRRDDRAGEDERCAGRHEEFTGENDGFTSRPDGRTREDDERRGGNDQGAYRHDKAREGRYEPPRNGTMSLLEVDNLYTEIQLRTRVIKAVDGVSFRVEQGETVGIVGESGCGKTMTATSIMRLLPHGGHIVGGSVRLAGRDLTSLSDPEMRSVRGNEVGMIFQDPMTSLNPTMNIGRQISESVVLHKRVSKRQGLERAAEVLSLVGMPNPAERLGDYPHQLSGGLRQRVMIAMALACEPKLLIADEPTTALDVTIQAQILALLDDLKSRLGMAILLITHDMGVIAGHVDRTMVMYAGEIIESADTERLFDDMHHPYTEALLASIPQMDQDKNQRLYAIRGLPPDLSRPLKACRFSPRCRYATDVCRTDEPPLGGDDAGHPYACFHPVSRAVEEIAGAGDVLEVVVGNGLATGPDSVPGPGTAGNLGPASAAPGTPGILGPGTAGNLGPGTAGNVGPGTSGNLGPGTAGNRGPSTAGNFGPGTPGNLGPGAAGVPYGAGPGGAALSGAGAFPMVPPMDGPALPLHNLTNSDGTNAPRGTLRISGEDLVAGTPPVAPLGPSQESPVILELRDVRKEYVVTAGAVMQRKVGAVQAVRGVNLSLRQGETLGVVGESGCGKSTLGRMVVGLERPTSGSVLFDGVDLTRLTRSEARRGHRDLALMFQDPYSSLDPRMRVGTIIREPLVVQGIGSPDEQRERVHQLLREVGLPPHAVELYPHEFSGGQRQRIGLARALALNPRLIVTDEPVSALDVSIRSQILNLMKHLQATHGLSYVFISHDLSVVRYLADRIAVMYLGKLVEIGTGDDIYSRPAHPYTAGLIGSIPVPNPTVQRARTKIPITGELPSPLNPPSGCPFRTRCPKAQPRCAEEDPALSSFGGQHYAACFYPLQEPALPLAAVTTAA